MSLFVLASLQKFVYNGNYSPELCRILNEVLPGSSDDPMIAEALLADVKPMQASLRGFSALGSDQPDGVSLGDWLSNNVERISSHVDSLERQVAGFGEQVKPVHVKEELSIILSPMEKERCQQFQMEIVREKVNKWQMELEDVSSVEGDQSPHYSPTPSLQLLQPVMLDKNNESPRYSPTSSMVGEAVQDSQSSGSLEEVQKLLDANGQNSPRSFAAVVSKNLSSGSLSTIRVPPRGLAILQEVTGNYGICSTQYGERVAFNKSTLLDGGSLDIPDLSSVFRAGDWLNITGSSRFHAAERPDVPFTVRRMEWFRGTNNDFKTKVAHAVFLSRVPEPVFGITNYRHLDASPVVFSGGMDSLSLDICRTCVARFTEDPTAPHHHRASVICPLASRWEERIIFWHQARNQSMLAMGAVTGEPVYVPRAVLAYRGLEADKRLIGEEMSAVTSPILPYEKLSENELLKLGVSQPQSRAFLLFLRK